MERGRLSTPRVDGPAPEAHLEMSCSSGALEHRGRLILALNEHKVCARLSGEGKGEGGMEKIDELDIDIRSCTTLSIHMIQV